jgi:hypothetical protein
MTTFFVVNLGMTAPAEGLQVLQRIVPQLFGGGHSSSINVMDMQILGGTTPLASEVVALQGRLPIASEVVVIPSPFGVFLSLRVLLKSFARLLSTPLLETGAAVLLRARRVREASTALNAVGRGADWCRSLFLPEFTKVQDVLLLPVRRAAGFTALLGGACGLVEHGADYALTLLKAAARLTVGGQGAGLAPLEAGRCLGNLGSAVWAIEDAVFAWFHNLSDELSLL